MKKYIISLSLAFAALFYISACDKSTDHGEETETPEMDLCEHMEESATAITADDTAPMIAGHKHYNVTLTGGADAKGGSLSLEADETNDFVFGLDKNIAFKLEDSDGNTVAEESKKTSDLPCADLAVSHTYELDAGTYTVRFGPSSETKVSFVMVEAGGHEH